MKKTVVIGGNAAGMSFAAKYRRNCRDEEIVVIEQRDYVSFGACGLPYFTANMFDDTERMISRTPEQAIKSGLDLRVNSQVLSLNRDNQTLFIESEGTTYSESYDQLIICTGATPIKPNFGSYNPKHVYTLTTQEDGLAVKEAFNNLDLKRICVIGAGFIGLEVFDSAHHLGKDVTVIEREASILTHQFSSEMVNIVEQDMINQQCELKLNCTVNRIEDNSDGSYNVITDSGSVIADIIILSLGFKPNTELFDLDKAQNGALLTDKLGQTNDANIYAMGDCAMAHHQVLEQPVYLPLATTANKQARMMADHLAGKETFLEGFLGSSCLKVLDQELATTGITEATAKRFDIPYKTVLIEDKNQTDYYPGQEDIMVKLIYSPASKVLLGGEVVGKKGAVGRVNALAVAVTAKMTTSQLGYLDFCYAPPFARTWDTLNVAGNVAK
ncbi:CoA-disulfide reductase [Vibrio sp. SS-MA-C1-2]|uniref:CoA-disulfide reductase n=1 Tax=Vibrio sp. SS-MA-C1-2 TaxID=2908646 RepID=UPI001F3379DB|nr:CoA-disulfide reductase [Vibrio sp. SS-MA-C1-2]UJF16837.1 CoA-disulfide reductase [Vibrio sp. SS-MA-C1-2]